MIDSRILQLEAQDKKDPDLFEELCQLEKIIQTKTKKPELHDLP
jgi:hypothetical protein